MERYSDAGVMTKNSTGGWVRFCDHTAIVASHEAVERELAKMILEQRKSPVVASPSLWGQMLEEALSEARRRNKVRG